MMLQVQNFSGLKQATFSEPLVSESTMWGQLCCPPPGCGEDCNINTLNILKQDINVYSLPHSWQDSLSHFRIVEFVTLDLILVYWLRSLHLAKRETCCQG